MPYQGSCGAEDLLHCLGCRNVHPNRRTAAGGLAESWQQGWGGTLMGTRAGVCGRGTGKEAAGRRRAGGRARDRRRWAQHRERRWGRGDKRRDERGGGGGGTREGQETREQAGAGSNAPEYPRAFLARARFRSTTFVCLASRFAARLAFLSALSRFLSACSLGT